jgi:hypothetical protein
MPDIPRAFAHHHEGTAFVDAPADRVFAHVDDHARLSSHMSQSSWMMGGGRMEVELDEGQGRRVGSRIRVAGRVFGVRLSLEEVVIERTPPRRKVWETTVPPRLLVMGHYRMGFEITPEGRGSRLRVFIDYALPDAPTTRWLGYLFAASYARWCTQRMAGDAAKAFAPRLNRGNDEHVRVH